MHTQVLQILILIVVQHLQNVVFALKRCEWSKSLLSFPPTDDKILSSKISHLPLSLMLFGKPCIVSISPFTSLEMARWWQCKTYISVILIMVYHIRFGCGEYFLYIANI